MKGRNRLSIHLYEDAVLQRVWSTDLAHSESRHLDRRVEFTDGCQ